MGGATMITGAHSLWDLLERRVDATPDGIMLIDAEGHTLSFSAFRDRCEAVAADLYARGVREGSVVSWQLPTRVSTVVLSMALSRLGAVQVPIIHLYREREVGFALRQTAAQLFIIPRQWRGIDYPEIAERALADAQERPDVLVIDDEPPTGDPTTLPPPPAEFAEGDAPVRWIYYTSGSTADPKGVRHTDRSLIAGGMGLVHALELVESDVGSVAFPFAHIAGPDYLVTVFSVGFPSVLVESFSPAECVPLFRSHGVTMVGGSTAFYVAYLAEQRKQPGEPILPDLRLMSGGGAAKPPNFHFEVQSEIGGRGIVHGYGMTEVPMIANGSPSDTDEQLAHTDGKPVRGAEVRLVAADGTPVAVGEEGEIRVRGPMVFLGYTDPSLDADAFDADGFFRTGDLGRFRPDGHLSVTGRLKDVIIRKGENVSAKEVEDVLSAHPKVAEVAVIGLPDPERGERVCAVVRLTEGSQALGFDEMVAFCRSSGLMTQKIPEQLEIRSEMPRAASGKIVKRALQDDYRRAAADPAPR